MKTRVLILAPAIGRSGGGVSESARLFTEALIDDDRFEPEVVTLQSEDFEVDRARWPDIPIHAFRAFGPANYGFSPGMLFHVLRRRADIVHVHGIWMFHVLCAALWCALWNKPALVTPHGMLEPWILQRSRRLKAAVSGLYQNRFLRRATLHVLTEKERGDVEAAGLPTDRTVIIPNYVAPAAKDAGRPNWWRPHMEPRRIYLFFGRIHDKKGWHELCTAWDRLSTADPDFRSGAQLVFCGWADDCQDFAPTVSALSKKHANIVFAGPQFGADRDRSYQASDVFVLPSKSEGLPMAVLEAWGAGLPSVMTDACNLNQGFAAGAALRTGESVEAITATLRHVQGWSMEELDRAAAAARHLVATTYSKPAVGSQMTDLLDAMTATPVEEAKA